MRTWVFPMAGYGNRVKKRGLCKPLINIIDRPIFSWCLTGLLSIIDDNDIIVVITTRYIEDTFDLSEKIKGAFKIYNLDVDFRLVTVVKVPDGPACSIFKAREHYIKSNQTIVVNSDQFIQFSFPTNNQLWDVFVPLYVNTTGQSSYAIINNGKITKIKEKILISNYASAGVYGFSNGELLVRCLAETLKGDPHRNNEYYIGPAINNLVISGYRVVPVGVTVKYDLGSPNGIDLFTDFVKVMRNTHTKT